jgi:hypothetical protein
MTAFMSMLDGKNDSARKALKKFGAKLGIQNDDLGMYTLQDPKVSTSLACRSVRREASRNLSYGNLAPGEVYRA